MSCCSSPYASLILCSGFSYADADGILITHLHLLLRNNYGRRNVRHQSHILKQQASIISKKNGDCFVWLDEYILSKLPLQ